MSYGEGKRDRGGLASFQARRTTADIHVGSLVSTATLESIANSVLVVGEVRELVGSDRDLHSRIFDIRARGVECRIDGFANLVQRTQGTALQGNVGQSERGIIDVFGEGKRDRGGLASFQARRTTADIHCRQLGNQQRSRGYRQQRSGCRRGPRTCWQRSRSA